MLKLVKISIRFYSRKWYDEIINQIKKNNLHVQGAGAEILKIKELLEKMTFNINLKLVREHEDPVGYCSTQLLKCLIKECDNKAREV